MNPNVCSQLQEKGAYSMREEQRDQFHLVSKFQPTGDQPQAIQKLVDGLNAGMKEQTLLGVTGSGKTFTMANVIARVNRPTLVLAHNHPSGNPAPSRGDMLATCRVALALESIDAQLVDHLIFTEDDMFSFQESGMLGSILRHNLSLHKETLTVLEEIYKQLPLG